MDRALTTTRVMTWGLMKLGTHEQQKIFEANREKREKLKKKLDSQKRIAEFLIVK